MSEYNFSRDFIDRLRNAKSIVVLTGAGVSKESGIPTFRDALTGLWAEYNPEDLATVAAYKRNPKFVWDWYQMRREMLIDVKPNPGHEILKKIEDRVDDFTLITQNVDGLHRKAGSKNVIELHGNILRSKCFEEGDVVNNWQEETDTPPICRNCGAFLRPDVVWFGEMLPEIEMGRAIQAIQKADMFFSVGTSALVQPAAFLPLQAKNAGAYLVEINPENTPLTAYADIVFQGPSGEVLPELYRQVWEEQL